MDKEIFCTSLYGARTHEGRVQMTCQAADFTVQMSIAEAQDLAANLIGCAAAAETDHAVAAWLRKDMAFDEHQIAAALAGVRAARKLTEPNGG